VDIKDVNTMYELAFGPDSAAQLNTLIKNRFFAGLNSAGPLALAWVNRAWGIGLFNTSRFTVAWLPSAPNQVRFHVSEDIAVAGGWAFRFGDVGDATFDIGLSAKGFVRLVDQDLGVLTKISSFFSAWRAHPFQVQVGAGFDAGFQYTWAKTVYLAAVAHDIGAPVYVANFTAVNGTGLESGVAQVRRTIDLGAALRVSSPFFRHYISDLMFLFDYTGISELFSETQRSQLLDLGAGLEIQFLHALDLRVGFSQMMPAFGLGLAMGVLKLDIAYYGEEFGTAPGDFRSYSFALNLNFKTP
jgi:hypothetical protein